MWQTLGQGRPIRAREIEMRIACVVVVTQLGMWNRRERQEREPKGSNGDMAHACLKSRRSCIDHVIIGLRSMSISYEIDDGDLRPFETVKRMPRSVSGTSPFSNFYRQTYPCIRVKGGGAPERRQTESEMQISAYIGGT